MECETQMRRRLRNSPMNGMPRLTTRLVARLQGFPDDWTFSVRKTAAYWHVGNTFPSPVARIVATAIRNAIYEIRGT